MDNGQNNGYKNGTSPNSASPVDQADGATGNGASADTRPYTATYLTWLKAVGDTYEHCEAMLNDVIAELQKGHVYLGEKDILEFLAYVKEHYKRLWLRFLPFILKPLPGVPPVTCIQTLRCRCTPFHPVGCRQDLHGRFT